MTRQVGTITSLWIVMMFFAFNASVSSASPYKEPSTSYSLLNLDSGDRAPILVAARRKSSKARRTSRKPQPVAPQSPEPAKEATETTPTETEAPSAAEGATPNAAAESNELTPTPAPTPDTATLQRGSRVEFDGRLVQGQTAKSGAIYLFGRKRSDLKTMVKEREHYRNELLRTVFPPR